MKKIISILLICASLTSVLSLSACGNNRTDDTAQTSGQSTTDQSASNQTPSDDGASLSNYSLQEIADSIQSADHQYPSLVSVTDADEGFDFQYEFGIQKPEGVQELLVVKPMIGSIPFSIGLLRVDDKVDAAALASTIKSSVDPNKLICDTSTFVDTQARGHVIILVMDNDNARGQALIDAFKAL